MAGSVFHRVVERTTSWLLNAHEGHDPGLCFRNSSMGLRMRSGVRVLLCPVIICRL